ncbi:MAG: beta-lactamase family protein [Leptospiraceae bacterium]|nr:beta-lactamase family protein [Leptospiraceae bacterium]
MKYWFLKIIILSVMLFSLHCNITSTKEGETKIEEIFQKAFKNSKHSKAATLLVHSDSLKIHLTSSVGFIESNNEKRKIIPNQPFHIASIGKIFTSVLIYQLIESGKLSLDEPVQKILGADLLKDLFVYEGIDHSNKVTVSQLLSHTSGIADYFESTDKEQKAVIQELIKEPDRFWKPLDLLDFTRKNQKPVAAPGGKFHYSDTGYILLGLIIEKISGISFEQYIQEKIFNRLGMKNSYMYLRSEPSDKSKLPISTMMLGNTDVTNFKSISADWAGGGIISTTEDLFLFQDAFIKGKLVSNNTYLSMIGKNKFMDGIYYGYGLMTVRFKDMSFFIPQTPDLHGHSGLLGTVLFYSPDYDAHIIANLGSTDDVGDSFEMMIWIMQTLKEIKNLQKK